MNDPQTPEQWHEAALLAEVMIRLDSAVKYGFVSGGPEVNLQRCLEIKYEAEARGVVVTSEQLDEAVQQYVTENAS